MTDTNEQPPRSTKDHAHVCRRGGHAWSHDTACAEPNDFNCYTHRVSEYYRPVPRG